MKNKILSVIGKAAFNVALFFEEDENRLGSSILFATAFGILLSALFVSAALISVIVPVLGLTVLALLVRTRNFDFSDRVGEFFNGLMDDDDKIQDRSSHPNVVNLKNESEKPKNDGREEKK